MTVSLIVAAARNGAIGLNNQMPWHLPNDMKFFKGITWAMPLVMGRKTFESIGSKGLRGRHHIVISRNSTAPVTAKESSAAGVLFVNDIPAALEAAAATGCKEVFIAGGGEIYRQTLALAHRIYLTRVETEPEADTFFPEIPESEWRLAKRLSLPADEKHAFAYAFEQWERI